MKVAVGVGAVLVASWSPLRSQRPRASHRSLPPIPRGRHQPHRSGSLTVVSSRQGSRVPAVASKSPASLWPHWEPERPLFASKSPASLCLTGNPKGPLFASKSPASLWPHWGTPKGPLFASKSPASLWPHWAPRRCSPSAVGVARSHNAERCKDQPTGNEEASAEDDAAAQSPRRSFSVRFITGRRRRELDCLTHRHDRGSASASGATTLSIEEFPRPVGWAPQLSARNRLARPGRSCRRLLDRCTAFRLFDARRVRRIRESSVVVLVERALCYGARQGSVTAAWATPRSRHRSQPQRCAATHKGERCDQNRDVSTSAVR